MAVFPPPVGEYGTNTQKDKIWLNGAVINLGPAEMNPAQSFQVDPYLPSQGQVPHAGNIDLDFVMIPRARIVGEVARNMGGTLTGDVYLPTHVGGLGDPLLTLCDGKNVNPLGFTFENVIRPGSANRTPDLPRWRRAGYMEAPFLAAVNNAYGTVYEGDFVTAHYGSVDSLSLIAYEDRGKPVKWVEKAFYHHQAAASASHILTNANLPGIQPEILMAFTAAGSYVSGAVTLAWNTTSKKWQVTYPVAVTDIHYSFGQSARHIAGQCINLYQISSQQDFGRWLEWVELDYNNLIYPPMVFDYPSIAIGANGTGVLTGPSGETPTVTTNDVYVMTLAHNHILPHKNIVVYVTTGAVLNNDGTLTDISGTQLQLRQSTVFENFAYGQHYQIDFVRGVLYLSHAIRKSDGSEFTVQADINAAIKVCYYYSDRYEYGMSRYTGAGVGLRGQTDGRFTGLPGTPSHLERAANDTRFTGAAGAFGAMRVLFG